VSNADIKADVARDDHEDVPPRSSSSQVGHFVKWKRAGRQTALLHEAGYFLLGLASLATVTGLYFWLHMPLVSAAFTYLVVLVLLSLVSNFSSLIVLSFIGACCLNYFFAPPLYSFRVDYAQDLITISAFLITSLVVNFLVTRVRVEQRDHMRTCETLRDANQRLEATNNALRIENLERKRVEQTLRESEYKLRRIFDTVPGMLWSAGPDGEHTHINQWVLDYSGMRLEDFVHLGWHKRHHPDDLSRVANAFSHALQTGTSYQVLSRLRRADGEYRWHHIRAEPLRDRQGNIIQWYGLSVDIDEAKKAEDRLRRSEEYLAEAQRLSHSGVAAYNETAILYGSEEIYRIWGFDLAQGVPSRAAVFQRVHPDDRDRLNAEVQRAVSEKRRYSTEYRILTPDGTVKHLEAIGQPVFSTSGELAEIVTTQIDVTERKCVERALRESEAKIRRLVDANIIGIFIWDFDGRILEANEAFLDILGYDHEDLVAGSIRWTDLTPPEWRDRDTQLIQEQMAAGSLQPFEKEYFRKDGSRVAVLIGVATFEEGGNQGVAFVLDLTERKRAEQALRESEASARSAIDGIAGLVAIMTPNGEVETVNRQCIEYFGRPLEEQKDWVTTDMVHPEDLPHMLEVFKKAIASEIPYHFEQRLRRFDGEYRWFDTRGGAVRDDTGRIVRWYVLLTDIEDRIRALARFDQMQADFAHMNRVSMMGELVASLSHEIAQPIASARINVRAAQNFLDMQPPDLGEVRQALARIAGNAGRAGDIIERIRDQIRKAPPRKQRFDLNAAIDEVIGLGRSAIINNRVWVQTRLSEGLCPVHGDRVQLQQVVLNLLLNALEAMGPVEAAPRELLISTRQDHASVLVAVQDSGPGIDPEHLERVFNSFYTTKPSGTGMGLSICRSIVDAHGGRLWAEANEPRGTIFQFTLPAA
jgi:PAS domain S-box-containing protein